MTGRLRQISLHVLGIDRAVEFYRDVLDLTLIARFGSLAFFDLDGVRLLVSTPEGVLTGNSVLYLAVDDLASRRALLESRGVHFVDEPHRIFDDPTGIFGEPGHAEWMTFFEDPEGNLLALSARVPSS